MTILEYFLDEAKVIKSALEMDQDDISYLQQFPYKYWPQALKYRYNQGLLKALDASGNIKSDWQDLRDISIRKTTFKHINSGMTKLVNKLKGLGYDLRDPDEQSQTLVDKKLMSTVQAINQINHWKKFSQDQGATGDKKFNAYNNPNLQPGFKRYTPNKLEYGQHSFEPNSQEERSKWAEIKDDVINSANRLIAARLEKLSSPDNPLYLNYFYWRDKKEDLLKDMIKRVMENLADPRIKSKGFRTLLLSNYFQAIQQTGYAGRRRLERAKALGVNIPKLLKKGYTPQQIADSLPGSGRPYNPLTANDIVKNMGKPLKNQTLTPSPDVTTKGKIRQLRQKVSQYNIAKKTSSGSAYNVDDLLDNLANTYNKVITNQQYFQQNHGRIKDAFQQLVQKVRTTGPSPQEAVAIDALSKAFGINNPLKSNVAVPDNWNDVRTRALQGFADWFKYQGNQN